jgi:hypothetical protein
MKVKQDELIDSTDPSYVQSLGWVSHNYPYLYFLARKVHMAWLMLKSTCTSIKVFQI